MTVETNDRLDTALGEETFNRSVRLVSDDIDAVSFPAEIRITAESTMTVLAVVVVTVVVIGPVDDPLAVLNASSGVV